MFRPAMCWSNSIELALAVLAEACLNVLLDGQRR
jgi:hypothetical protein